MNPLELFLFLTFLIYAFLYKIQLFLIYALLVLLYILFIQKAMRPPPQSLKQKILAGTWKHPSEGPIRVCQELDVTKSVQYVRNLSIKSGHHVTLTHAVVRALSLGLNKFPEIKGHLKFGNFQAVGELGITVVSDVDSGKDLVPIEFYAFGEMAVEDIAEYCNERVYRAKREKDELHKKRTNPNKYVPNFLINWMMYVMCYVINNLGLPVRSYGFKGRDFGQCVLSNVGVFGMKKGFAPMSHASGTAIQIAMGKAFKKACVQEGNIVIKEKMLFNYTSDHRYGDGGRAIKCVNTIYDYLNDPEEYEKKLKA